MPDRRGDHLSSGPAELVDVTAAIYEATIGHGILGDIFVEIPDGRDA